MSRIIEITSLDHDGLAPYAHLTEAQLRSRQHPEHGIFIAESAKVIAYALEAGCVPISMLMEKRHVDGDARDLIARAGDIPIYTGEREILGRLTGYALTRGVLCAMRRPAKREAGEVIANAWRVAVLEGIVDASNMGAIMRSAAALGVDALLLSPSCCDPLYRRAVRVSMGAVFLLPWATVGKDSATWLADCMALLHAQGFVTAAMALRADALPIDDGRLAAAERLAIFLGTEGDGLKAETVAACDHCAMIPMRHGMDSLNVAAASAVAFWELRARQ